MSDVIVWEHPALRDKPSHEVRTSDGPYRIEVSGTFKRRLFRHTLGDVWSILWRRDVSSLTDEAATDDPQGHDEDSVNGDGWQVVDDEQDRAREILNGPFRDS